MCPSQFASGYKQPALQTTQQKHSKICDCIFNGRIMNVNYLRLVCAVLSSKARKNSSWSPQPKNHLRHLDKFLQSLLVYLTFQSSLLQDLGQTIFETKISKFRRHLISVCRGSSFQKHKIFNCILPSKCARYPL